MPTREQIANAVEIIKMCQPIFEYQGGMWFGSNDRFADATFVDYGACRAFGVAARALPGLVTELELIADWRKVNLAGEYEHSLRDIIRSMLDCADRALTSIKGS